MILKEHRNAIFRLALYLSLSLNFSLVTAPEGRPRFVSFYECECNQGFTLRVIGVGGGGLMVSALDSGSSVPGSSPGRENCVVLLSKALYSHSASLHSGV